MAAKVRHFCGRAIPLLRRTSFWLVLTILIMGYCLYDQQQQLIALQAQVNSQYDMKDSDSFDYRITNLEHISNAHGDRIATLEDDLWQTRRIQSDLQWRLIQLEWLHPDLKVNHKVPEENKTISFDRNPGKVPSPLAPNESIFIKP